MGLLGTAGGNRNFSPAFALPSADWTLVGYTATTYGGVLQYPTVDLRRLIPQAKLAAVAEVLETAGVEKFLVNWGWDAVLGAVARSFTLMFARADLNDPWLAASITTLLEDMETAITA